MAEKEGFEPSMFCYFSISYKAHKVKKRISLARLTEVLRYQFEVFNTRPSRNQYANRASTLRTPNAASTSTFPDISQNQ